MINQEENMSKQTSNDQIMVDAGTFELANWMLQLDDNIKLNQLIMPGSHDAGMSELHHCDIGSNINTGLVQTQGLSISKQLQAGSRYFDIRVDYDHKELVTYHRSGDSGCNGQSLETVFNESVEFIKSHRSETFILKFSHIRSNRNKEQEIKERIDQFISQVKYKEFLFIQPDNLVNLAEIPLGSFRGKFVLVFDYPEFINVKQGRFRYHDGFEVDKSETIVKRLKSYEPNLTVCDSYSDTTTLDKMKKDQLNKLDKYGGFGKDYLFLLSWTLTSGFKTFFGGSVKELAAQANTALPEALYQQIVLSGKAIPNIVYIDYVNAITTKCIIQYNFLNKKAI
jgi:1-phosphatidylinositol phosphodiesterase